MGVPIALRGRLSDIMRIVLATLTAISLVALLAPTAAAVEPQCLQVYPWSELCEGDVEGFLRAYGIETVEPCLKNCVPPIEPGAECIQVYPWSALCSGDVGAFVCYYVHCDVIVA